MNKEELIAAICERLGLNIEAVGPEFSMLARSPKLMVGAALPRGSD